MSGSDVLLLVRSAAKAVNAAFDRTDDGEQMRVLGNALADLDDAEQALVLHRIGAPLLSHTDYGGRAAVERLVGHLLRLGERALAEFLDEVARRHGIGSDILAALNAWRRITPEMVRLAGADRFAPHPPHVVGGRP